MNPRKASRDRADATNRRMFTVYGSWFKVGPELLSKSTRAKQTAIPKLRRDRWARRHAEHADLPMDVRNLLTWSFSFLSPYPDGGPSGPAPPPELLARRRTCRSHLTPIASLDNGEKGPDT